MITAKQMVGTEAHVQLRWYIEQTMGQEYIAYQRASALGKLVTKYLNNCNKQHPNRGIVPRIINAFLWDITPEGTYLWDGIHSEFDNCPDEFKDKWLGKPKREKVKVVKVKKQAPRQVGWWV